MSGDSCSRFHTGRRREKGKPKHFSKSENKNTGKRDAAYFLFLVSVSVTGCGCRLSSETKE